MQGFKYQRLAVQDGRPHAGVFETPHGVVNTPVFMPVGTRGTVKSLDPNDLNDIGAQIILANTYHLYLQPGEEVVGKLGGLHQMMRWEKPILTDSGGYQVSSLGLFRKKGGDKLAKIDDEGVTFYSHLDGSQHRFDPEKAIRVQVALGSDIIMAFDEATPKLGKQYTRESMKRTHRWLERGVNIWKELESAKPALDKLPQALFGIIQGGSYRDLRRESAREVLNYDLPGVALGGATIGQTPEETEENLAMVRDLLPDDKPLYLMGVGVKPTDAIEAVKSGADMFDCVAPTKLARSGLLYCGRLEVKGREVTGAKFAGETESERLNIGNRKYNKDERPICDWCDCATCKQGYSRAYLRHLFKARELLFYRLASRHNLRMMIRVVEELRKLMVGEGS